MADKIINLFNANCCGEIGDVIVEGDINLEGASLLEQSDYLFQDNSLRNFLLNEPRGGVFKHFNLIVPPKDKKASAGFIIMEPEDNPPMSGSNSICVATVLLEKNLIIKIQAHCEHKKVRSVEIQNLPSFVDQLEVKLNTPNFGSLNVSTVFGGDSFLICDASDFDLSIQPENAKKFVEIAQEIIPLANKQLGFHHPSLTSLNYISFCQFIEPVVVNAEGNKEGKNTVCIRPGKLDRSPSGTGTSARLALMREKNEINLNETFISKSIIGSLFESTIVDEFMSNNKNMVIPTITGSAFITGKQELYLSKNDPFPKGYRLNDTWPQY